MQQPYQSHPSIPLPIFPSLLSPQLTTVTNNQCSLSQWCTYQSIDNYSIVVQDIYLGYIIIFFILIVRNSIKVYKYRKDQQLKQLFGWVYVAVSGLLIVWALCATVKVIINIWVYYAYMAKYNIQININIGNNDIDNVMISQMAGWYEMFDCLATLSLILLLIIIPTQWLKQVTDTVNKIPQTDIQFSMRKKINYLYTLLKIINIYLIARIFSVIYFTLQPHYIGIPQFGCQMPRICSIFIISQASVMLLCYLAGYIIIVNMRGKKLFTIQQKYYKKILQQYRLLFTILIMRIIYHLFYRFLPQWIYKYDPNEYCIDNQYKNKVFRTFMMIIDHGVMHLMAVYVFIHIYKADINEVKINSNIFAVGSGEGGMYESLRTHI